MNDVAGPHDRNSANTDFAMKRMFRITRLASPAFETSRRRHSRLAHPRHETCLFARNSEDKIASCSQLERESISDTYCAMPC
jgi:hypothetical protein